MLSSSRRAKGNTFEYDVEYSLQQKDGDYKATERRGFAQGYDIVSKYRGTYVECKFHQTMTWNELVKIHDLLKKRTPEALARFVIFKTNLQPVLVFDGIAIKTFEFVFGVEFQKRPKKTKIIR